MASGLDIVASGDGGLHSLPQAAVVGYRVDGAEIYRRRYAANVWKIEISQCGRYVAARTLNAANQDGYRLEVLDLVESRVVFSVSPSTGLLPDGYSFVVSAKGLEKIFVEHVTLGRFAYDSSGRFLDAKSFQAAQLEKGDYVQKLVAIRALIESDKTLEAATRAVPITQQALAEGANARPDWASIAFRVQGEAYERLSHPVAALLAYEQALSINRKIALRNRIRELRKVVFDSSPR